MYDSTIVYCAKCKLKLSNCSAVEVNGVTYLYKYCKECNIYVIENKLIDRIYKLNGIRRDDLILYDFNKKNIKVSKKNKV